MSGVSETVAAVAMPAVVVARLIILGVRRCEVRVASLLRTLLDIGMLLYLEANARVVRS